MAFERISQAVADVETRFSMLYIAHDLSLAMKIADWVYVMRDGEIVEEGPAGDIFNHPRAECTRALICG